MGVVHFMYVSIPKEIFHVHSYRCGHAEEVEDEAYVKRAVELGANRIVFTDHVPYPNDYFQRRMKYEELDGYIKTINELKTKYKKEIEILCGLEAEFVVAYKNYYEELRERLDLLVLGQHFYEVNGEFSFNRPKEEVIENEYRYSSEAIIQGIESGLFDVVVHPDRIFRRRKQWEDDMAAVGTNIISAAVKHDIPLEINISSQRRNNQFWPEFWKLIEDNDGFTRCRIITGFDAHHVSELQVKE